MTTTLVLPGPIADEIAVASREPLEQAAVLLARRIEADGDVRLLARRLHWAPSDAYAEQSPHRMLIRSEGYVGALGAAEVDRAIPIWLHTHPSETGVPLPSRDNRPV
jgi:hypothetical protein